MLTSLIPRLRQRALSAHPVEAKTITDTEAALGRALPASLRRVYEELGTGWGPEYGLLSPSQSLALHRQWVGEKPPEYAAWRWPPTLFPLLDWGCQIYSCVALDDPEAPVTRFRGDDFVPDDPDGGTAPPTPPEGFATLLVPESESLAAWLGAWLDGSLKF